MLSQDRRLFFLRWLSNPLRVGAVVPSSRKLAQAIAEQISVASEDYIVELGPGTGVVTRALLEGGLSEKQIIVVELDHRFASQLKHRFPNITVLEGDARNIKELLHTRGITEVAAIVSCLPLLSMPDAIRLAIVHRAFDILKKDGAFVQFTYGLLSPVPEHHQHTIGIRGRIAKRVWHNFPPARIWKYKTHATPL